jgi:hypothetical protein|tara:strand:+ start:274 stop:1026 length:753 start_codon:yes stop_codon:yes gene_type:complete
MTWNLVTYADEKFEDKQEYLNSIAEKCGFNTIPFTREGIESSLFYKENKEILDNPVGNGYWAWKPYIILNAMNRLNDGDIVLYADCGDMFHPNINKYVDDLLDEDDQCLLLMGGFENGQWTKRDCFVYMDCDSVDYWSVKQLETGVCIWKVSDESKKTVAEWLKWCCDPRVITNDESVCEKPELMGFKEHRNDQSVLTNIAVRDGLTVDNGPLRNFIECNYDYWYERNEQTGYTLNRPIDKFLIELKENA